MNEEIERIHEWLDKQAIPRHQDGEELSIIGRIKVLRDETWEEVSSYYN